MGKPSESPAMAGHFSDGKHSRCDGRVPEAMESVLTPMGGVLNAREQKKDCRLLNSPFYILTIDVWLH